MCRPFGLAAGLGVGPGIVYDRSLVKAHLVRGLSSSILMVHEDVRFVKRQASELLQYFESVQRRPVADTRLRRVALQHQPENVVINLLVHAIGSAQVQTF